LRFGIKSMLVVTLFAAIAISVVVAYLPKAPAIPECLGDPLEDWQVQSLLKRYKTDQFTDHGKATYSYRNRSGTCELDFWGNQLMSVSLSVPVDPTLDLASVVSRLGEDATGSWQVSEFDSLDGPRLVIMPSRRAINQHSNDDKRDGYIISIPYHQNQTDERDE